MTAFFEFHAMKTEAARRGFERRERMRENLIMAAVTGLTASGQYKDSAIAYAAVKIADATLAELEKSA